MKKRTKKRQQNWSLQIMLLKEVTQFWNVLSTEDTLYVGWILLAETNIQIF